jgi:hypothetical protein
MGQKSNIQTLHLKNRHNINGIGLLPKEAINSISFMENLKNSLKRKQIYLIDSNLNLRNNTGNLTLTVFYKTRWFVRKRQRVIEFYAKKHELRKKSSLINKKKKLKNINTKENKNVDIESNFNRNLFVKNLVTKNRLFSKLLNNKHLVLEVINLNMQLLKTKIIKDELIDLCLPFSNKLFSRRMYLYNDFLKMSILLLMNKMKLSTYITVLAQIFRILPKKSHGIFYKFIETLFSFLVDTKNSTIKGARLLINGKLKGRLRSSTANFLYGKIERQTISASVDYAKTPIFTLYGMYGFHMWVNYDDNVVFVKPDENNEENKETYEKFPSY